MTSTEVNKSRHRGWHPHFHTILLVWAESETAAVAEVERCRGAWSLALQGIGAWCGEHGFQVQGACAAGDYVGKWGAAEELSLSGSKSARGDKSLKGWTPWELLAAAEGDEGAARAFQEYGLVFKGRRQLVWSPGLKKVVGINDLTDEEVAANETGPDKISEVVEVAVIERAAWRRILRAELRAELLDVAPGGYAAITVLLARAGIVSGVHPPGWRGDLYAFPGCRRHMLPERAAS